MVICGIRQAIHNFNRFPHIRPVSISDIAKYAYEFFLIEPYLYSYPWLASGRYGKCHIQSVSYSFAPLLTTDTNYFLKKFMTMYYVRNK